MNVWHRDWWDEDPLPVPPGPYGSAEFWRWWSARKLGLYTAPLDVQVVARIDVESGEEHENYARVDRRS